MKTTAAPSPGQPPGTVAMPVSLTQDFATVEELAGRLSAALEQIRQTGRPLVITEGGKPAAVLLEAARYEGLMHLLNPSRMLNEGMEDVRAGRVRPVDEVFKDILGELGDGQKAPRRPRQKRRA